MAKTMSEAHKKALAEGRAHARAVRAYLDALKATKPKRGRKRTPKRGRQRTPESIGARLQAIEADMDGANTLAALNLVQETRNLTAALAVLESEKSGPDLEALGAGFIKSAKYYSEAKGIEYRTWRDVGVPADILKKAGVPRTRS